ncbi:hypothetical protein D9758_006361 [Tetrapyrgos nigripes]|uniref:Fe2OG dioxygenase domain-containing protein n=1 Tax=Tetrapyrgos nigripes TaxID=182062 RepID=A0A8H5G010_9AGAR|nr:hypothetical protein D9758_006361 [Tetrapyrgos nigripes]
MAGLPQESSTEPEATTRHGNHVVKPWVYPPETKCIPEEQFIDLEVIDLSVPFSSSIDLSTDTSGCATSSAGYRGPGHDDRDISSTPSPQDQEIITRVLKAFHSTGLVALKGHGLASQEIQRQFDLGRLLNEDVGEEEKQTLHARIKEEGSWAGYKPRGYYKRPDGSHDYIEHYDFYPFTALESRLPEIAKPYLNEFRGFIEYNHYVILRKVLAVISLGLGLERDFLWRLHHRGDVSNGVLQPNRSDEEFQEWKHCKDHLRYAMYHPPSEEDRERRKKIWLPGHTDIGSVTFLYSQSIAGLQILTPNGEWKYIRHYPDHIIVDLGDSMEFLTGGVLKAAPHRVIEPPEDQRYLKRLGIFFFVPFLPEVQLRVIDHPSLRKLGAKDMFDEYYRLGGKPLTQAEWLVMKSKLVGTKRVQREKREPVDVLEDIHYRYNP